MGARHWTRAEAIRHPLFWAFCPSIFGLSAWGTALFFHQVHLAEVKGWTHADLTLLFSVFTVASVIVMLCAGAAIDRFGRRLLVPTYLIPVALGFMLLASATSFWVGGGVFVITGAFIDTNLSFNAQFPLFSVYLWVQAFWRSSAQDQRARRR